MAMSHEKHYCSFIKELQTFFILIDSLISNRGQVALKMYLKITFFHVQVIHRRFEQQKEKKFALSQY